MLPKPFEGVWLHYAVAVGLAILGGIVRMLVSSDTHTILGVIRNILIASFGGLMAYLFASGQGLSGHVTLFMTGMTGFAGVEGLRTLGKVYSASLRKDDDKDKEIDVLKGTKAAEQDEQARN